MFYKKFFTVALLMMLSIHVHAVVLNDGSTMAYSCYKPIWSGLKSLQKQDYDKLWYLCVACEQYNCNLTEIPTKEREGQISALYKNDTEKVETIALCNSLGLCDQDGKINKNNEQVIRLSIICARKAPLVPVLIWLRSPLTWSNYFSWRYWLSKD